MLHLVRTLVVDSLILSSQALELFTLLKCSSLCFIIICIFYFYCLQLRIFHITLSLIVFARFFLFLCHVLRIKSLYLLLLLSSKILMFHLFSSFLANFLLLLLLLVILAHLLLYLSLFLLHDLPKLPLIFFIPLSIC